MRWKLTELVAVVITLILILSILSTEGKRHHKHKHSKGRKKSVVSRSNIPQKPIGVQTLLKGAITGVKKSEEWHQNDKPQELTPETIKIVKKQESIKASELPGAFGGDAQIIPGKSTADIKSQRQGTKVAVLKAAKKPSEAPTNPTEAITIVDKQDHGGHVPGAKISHKKKYKKKGSKHVPMVAKVKQNSKIKSEKIGAMADKGALKGKGHSKKKKNKDNKTSLANEIVQKIVKLASASEKEDEVSDTSKYVEPATQAAVNTLPSAPTPANIAPIVHQQHVNQVHKQAVKAPTVPKKTKAMVKEDKDDGPVKSLLDELAADEEEEDDEESGSAMSEISSGAQIQAPPTDEGKLETPIEPDIECPWACYWKCENYCPKKCCNNPYHCPEECSMFCTTRCPDKCCPPGMKKLPDVAINFQPQDSKQQPQGLLPPQNPPQVQQPQQYQPQQYQPQQYQPQQQYPDQQYMSQQQVAQQTSAQTGYPGYCPLFCPNVCVPGSCQPECCGQQAPQVPAEPPQQMYYPPPPAPPPALPPPIYPPPPPPAPPPQVYIAPPQVTYGSPSTIPDYCPDVCSSGCVNQCPNECCPGMG